MRMRAFAGKLPDKKEVPSMKIRQRICSALAFLSFMWVLGVIGNSDLGYGLNVVSLAIGVAVFGISIWVGGFTK